MIVRNGHGTAGSVKALTRIDKVASININGAQMIGRPGVAKAIFSALADKEVNVMMISQGSSEANISLIVDESHIGAAVDALAFLVKNGVVREVTRNKDVCAVAVVGAGIGRRRRHGRADLHRPWPGRRERDDDLAGFKRGEHLVCCQAGGRPACGPRFTTVRLSEECN